MFIRLHHFLSGKEFFIPASHIVIIDGREEPNKIDVKLPGEKKTLVHTIIAKAQNTLTFEVRETPEEVASLVNEMLNMAARATKMN